MKAKILTVILILFLFTTILSSCKSNTASPVGDIVKVKDDVGVKNDIQIDDKSDEVLIINFNQNFKHEKYDGKKVTIRGYMSTLSPVNGEFIYLMNIPYQSCPFCLPNTTTLVNTVAVYAKNNRSFDFYDGPIEISGTFKVEDCKDEFGYEYPYKIVDASYTKIDTSVLSENLKTYGVLSQDGIINDLLNLCMQVDFNAYFEMYGAPPEAVELIPDTEFDKIISRVKAIDENHYKDFISIIQGFREYNKIVNTNFENSDYQKNSSVKMEEQIVLLFNRLYGWLGQFEI